MKTAAKNMNLIPDTKIGHTPPSRFGYKNTGTWWFVAYFTVLSVSILHSVEC
jgi:hypothetical protein